MKKFIELKYHQNSKQEIVFENLDEIKENDNVILRLKNGDLTALCSYALDVFYDKIESEYIGNQIYLPFCPKTPLLRTIYYIIGKTNFNIFCFDSKNSDNSDFNLKNILPKWNIPKDSTVLFLSEEDSKRYCRLYTNYASVHLLGNGITEHFNLVSFNAKKISIIIPELHAEDESCPYHIDNINKVCKELKEKYGVKRIELFVSHCFLYFYSIGNRLLKYEIDSGGGSYVDEYIDKITTTNSTSIFKVQKSDRLEVIDCVNFFDI